MQLHSCSLLTLELNMDNIPYLMANFILPSLPVTTLELHALNCTLVLPIWSFWEKKRKSKQTPLKTPSKLSPKQRKTVPEHSSFFCQKKLHSLTEVLSYNFPPSMHKHAQAQHTCILSLSPSLHLSASLFLSLCTAHPRSHTNIRSHILMRVN